MSNCPRIWIEATGLGGRGQRHCVTHNGVTLIESTKNPEFDSTRELLALGVIGPVEVWRSGTSFPAMRLDIEKAAKLTIEESDRVGPSFARDEKESAHERSLSRIRGESSIPPARTGLFFSLLSPF